MSVPLSPGDKPFVGTLRCSRSHRRLLATAARLTTRATLAGLATVAVLAALPADAGPNGGTVVGGSAAIQGQGTSSVTVNQSSQNAIINWATFNLGQGETTTFNQPNSTAVVLNRVIGGQGPSFLDGTLTANGRVFIINGDGILFGSHSSISTAGFLATTNDIRNDDFMAGKYNFNIPGLPNASIVNLGHITATSGGFAALVAPGVRNSGTISAKLGTVSLAAGNAFTLDFYGDQLITLAVNDQIAAAVKDVQTGETLKSLVSNTGKLKANGGRVELTATAARAVVDSVINNTGVIEANSIGTHNGMIVLSAATGASKGAGAPAQTVKLAGKISAAGKDKGTTGGTVVVTGENIVLTGATIDASGDAGGGKVLIGGDTGGGHLSGAAASIELAKLESFLIPTATTVSVDGASVINASATGSGNAGKVVVWSEQNTSFAGTILAQGGAGGGNGGFVETSSPGALNFTGGRVNTLAPMGTTGTWLLDPTDLTIDATAASTISNDLQTTSVILQTFASGPPSGPPGTTGNTGSGAGDINVEAPISWSSNSTLTLSAYHDIFFNNTVGSQVTLITNTGAGNLVLRADNTGTGSGIIHFEWSAHPIEIDFSGSTGTMSFYYNPIANPDCSSCTKYENPFNFSTNVNSAPGQLTSYMLVNNAADLQGIGHNNFTLSQTYALGKSFSASPDDGFSGFASGTMFSGLIDGNGGLGVNSTISNLTLSLPHGSDSYGLFPFIGSNGVVRNLNLSNVAITAGADIQFIGALTGNNSGTISNVAVLSGSVTGGSFMGIGAGGLVGQNNPGGLITGSSANVTVSVGDSTTQSEINSAGGLVASNLATIIGSTGLGNVSGGADSFVGGLVGQNGLSGGGGTGTISSSFASGNVSISGLSSSVGGLVGQQAQGSTITNSQAIGSVTSTATVPQQQGQQSAFTDAGGLVGTNSGTIAGTTTPTATSTCAQGAAFSCATGAVSVGSHGGGGGLVGGNQGTIVNALATGAVTGAAGAGTQGANGGGTHLGGLTASNSGLIQSAIATGNVGTLGVAGLNVGGLVSDNSGTIKFSLAIGNVSAGDNSLAGGLTADNSPGGCNGCGGGDGQNNNALILSSTAGGNVTVGADSLAGGLTGLINGIVTLSTASGNVTGGANSSLGGLVGLVAAGGGGSTAGLVSQSSASGAVTSTGANSSVGGLVAVNGGTISASLASGSVTGTSDSALGGFAGINLGLIQNSSTSSSVTGSGSHDAAGGFAGIDFGLIDPSTSSGNVSAGPNSSVGGFVGALAAFSNFSAGSLSGSSFPIGTVSSDSSGTGSASGGPGSMVGSQVGQSYPTNGLSGLALFGGAGCNDSACVFLSTGILYDPFPPPPPPVTPTTTQQPPPPQQQVIDNLTGNFTLVSLPPPVNVLAYPPPPTPAPPNVGVPRLIAVPPPGETRYIKDEVVLQVDCDTPQAAIDAVARALRLTVAASQCLMQTHQNLLRMHINGGQTVADVIRALARFQIIAVAQANFIYHTMQDQVEDPGLAGRTQEEGDAAQYALGKLGLIDLHKEVKGNNISIAVIDSQIDFKHPDLDGVFADQYDAVGGPAEKPHPHGTGMAGAIAAHHKLMGIAPSARIYAIHAFSSNAASADSTTYNILKGLDWATTKGVRIINMSFAGPRDPSMERALKLAHDKGIVLIAAAGNAGPKSPPLFPGADPNVIAVTATDANDKIFSGANRGRYIAVAAPGVDILVPAPDDTYQLTTGTSVSSAEVSGIVALLLERNPSLTPEQVRKILEVSAKHPGTKERDDDFGSGLVDPSKAMQDAAELKPVGQPTRR